MVVKVKDTLQSPLSLKCDRSRVSIPHLLPSPYHRATPYLIFSYWGLGGIPPRPSKKQRPAPPAGGAGNSVSLDFAFCIYESNSAKQFQKFVRFLIWELAK